MNRIYTTLFVLITGTTLFFSCNKKCDLGQDINSGEIINSISIYPNAGYLTSNLAPGDYLINSNHPIAHRFQMSVDEGITKSDVDYSRYSLICAPVNVSCFAVFDRNVLIDTVGHKVLYTVKIKECGKCDEVRYVENYAAIRAVPDDYELVIDVQKTSE